MCQNVVHVDQRLATSNSQRAWNAFRDELVTQVVRGSDAGQERFGNCDVEPEIDLGTYQLMVAARQGTARARGYFPVVLSLTTSSTDNGNSDHEPSIKALISGLLKSNKPSPSFLIHLSGTGIVADWRDPTYLGKLNPKVW